MKIKLTKWALTRWIVLFFVVFVLFLLNIGIRLQRNRDLPDPSIVRAGEGGCIVSEEAAAVHNREKGHEDAWIRFVNEENDDIVQVETIDTNLVLSFKVGSDDIPCFRKESIAAVTIEECAKNKEERCDFSLPHTVFVRTLLVQIVNWEYLESAF